MYRTWFSRIHFLISVFPNGRIIFLKFTYSHNNSNNNGDKSHSSHSVVACLGRCARLCTRLFVCFTSGNPHSNRRCAVVIVLSSLSQIQNRDTERISSGANSDPDLCFPRAYAIIYIPLWMLPVIFRIIPSSTAIYFFESLPLLQCSLFIYFPF